MVAFGVAIMAAFVVEVVALEFVVVGRNFFDVHAPPDFAPEMKKRDAFAFSHSPPAKTFVPTNRHKDKRGEDVKKIVVADLEAAVQLVHPLERGATAFAVVTVLHHFADDDVGVVVTLLRAAREFPGAIEQRGNRRHAKRAKERELQRARGVERKIDAATEKGDALMILHRIEPFDFGKHFGTHDAIYRRVLQEISRDLSDGVVRKMF